MKVNNTRIHHEGTIQPLIHKRMDIDHTAIAHIISVLTDLYSDPALAVIREYSCNAWDSHQAAGISDPIEITLPTQLSPTFVVEDHGVGLSVDDLTNLFSKYGWSSKRDTDGEVGMLGLGAKSGLTYTSQFTLVSVKNGVKTTVLVTRDSDGVGALQILDTQATDQRNGVRIEVPVGNPFYFAEKAKDFFSYWEEGTVLIDGEQPTLVGEKDLWVDPDIVLVPDKNNVGKDYIVMGNVPYPVDAEHRLIEGQYSRFQAVVRVPIGSVDFVPSREALQYTKRTKEVLDEARYFIKHNTKRAMQERIDALPTAHDAWKAWRRWAPSLAAIMGVGRTGFRPTWKGLTVAGATTLRQDILVWTASGMRQSRYYDSSRQKTLDGLIDSKEDVKFILGHNAMRLTRIEKDRLTDYFTGKRVTIVMMKQPLPSPWFDPIPVLRWENIKAATTDSVATRPKAEYVVLHKAEVQPAVTTYVSQKKANNFTDAYQIRKNWPEIEIYTVPARLERRFLKDFPDAVPLHVALKGRIQQWMDSLNPEERYHINHNIDGVLGATSATADDPAIQRLIDVDVRRRNDLREQRYAMSTLSTTYQLPWEGVKIDKKVAEAVTKYPLVFGGSSTADKVEYMNLLYRNGTKRKNNRKETA